MRRTVAAGLVVVGLLAGVAGCATVPDPEPSAKPTTTAKSTASPSPTPAPTVTPTPTPTSTPDLWQRFIDARMPYSFEVPPGWAVVEQPSPYGNQGPLQFLVNDGQGKQQLVFSSQASGFGGRCGDAAPLNVQEMDAEPATIPGYTLTSRTIKNLTSPQFVYRAMQTDKGVVASLGLSDEGITDSCAFYNLLHPGETTISFADATQVSAENPPHLFASTDEAKSFAQSDEYKTLKRILLSLQIAG
ncbi:hypothetical protein G7066_14205 [Leucobacter coleopterorum]|uniref:Lipoprotein n=1 Tax=Leucobacter coleopterorum TaxID=2714933 RepID=A0ABX6JYR0_9MICO|nr:hypothetical protein [Leucobacter coleopterorum]QIM19436.1 hypothetical protein G7066_14205 [Leucobacter coleopterorum]